ncbi:MAG: hypothetical protein AAF078_00855 [Planctomycetota bacterium]
MPAAEMNTPSDALIAAWIDRAQGIHAALQANPQTPSAWLWTIRLDVLQFLLQRYGHSLNLESLVTRTPPAESIERDIASDARPPLTSPGYREVSAQDASIRPPDQIRSRLDRIRNIGKDRYRRVEAEERTITGPLSTTYPEDLKQSAEFATSADIKPLPDALRDEHARFLRLNVKHLGDLTANGAAITDEDILTILGNQDSP